MQKKTKWQQMLEAPKGCVEYNPNQSFSLQVYWVVRSLTAAKEMIAKGFDPCSKATMRDTPTTLAYIFRVSHDQRMAEALKKEIKTIGDHPHYRSAFKSISMGIPKAGIESKLKLGGIDLTPLSWGPEEPISGHEKEIDYDPIVLECTEVYLDNRSFYEHTASHEWMGSSPEILLATRSLQPTTYCVGQPSTDIWEKVLEPSLKAIHLDNKDKKKISSGIYKRLSNEEKLKADVLFFIELDLYVKNEGEERINSKLASVQCEVDAPYMIVIERAPLEVRCMIAFPYSNESKCLSFGLLLEDCVDIQGRVIVYDNDNQTNDAQKRITIAKQFLQASCLGDCKSITILDGQQAQTDNILAGYPLHPLFNKLVANDQINYQP